MNTASGLIGVLWERAADSFTDEELADVARISEYATMQARGLAEVVMGIGCTVSSDANDGIRAGNFENPKDLFTLLCTISHGIDTIAGMMEVSSDASFRLANPEIYKQKAA